MKLNKYIVYKFSCNNVWLKNDPLKVVQLLIQCKGSCQVWKILPSSLFCKNEH